MVPWFCISALFDPPLSESTIERFVGLEYRIDLGSLIVVRLVL